MEIRELISQVEGDVTRFGTQAHALVMLHLREIEQRLMDLARFGLQYELSDKAAAPPVEYPKMMYHDNELPRVAQNEHEANDLESKGWRDKPMAEVQASAPLIPVPLQEHHNE